MLTPLCLCWVLPVGFPLPPTLNVGTPPPGSPSLAMLHPRRCYSGVFLHPLSISIIAWVTWYPVCCFGSEAPPGIKYIEVRCQVCPIFTHLNQNWRWVTLGRGVFRRFLEGIHILMNSWMLPGGLQEQQSPQEIVTVMKGPQHYFHDSKHLSGITHSFGTRNSSNKMLCLWLEYCFDSPRYFIGNKIYNRLSTRVPVVVVFCFGWRVSKTSS